MRSPTRRVRWLGALTASMLTVGASTAWTQDIEPRAYANAPVGVNFLVAGYILTQGGVAFDPALPIKNPDLTTSSAVMAYARVLDLWGASAKLDAIVPYMLLSGSADYLGQRVERVVDGLYDPRVRLSVNVLGAPALGLKDFAGYRQRLIVGGSVQVSAPVGQYNPDRLVNIGTNRWFIKGELGLSRAFQPWTLEMMLATTFYTDNPDFYGGKKREQAPIYSMQGHVVRSFRSGLWAALDVNYFTGGRTTVNGTLNNDLQQNWRVGGLLALPVNARHSVKLSASTGVSARTGNNFDLVGITWQYRWGGGLP